MIDSKTFDQIKQASVEERIQIIELIIQSLKKDLGPGSETGRTLFKRFKVRKFSLGEEVHIDRDSLYSERGL